MKDVNESIDFESIDKVICLSFFDIEKIEKYNFENQTKAFVEKVINKYNKYARDNNFDINTKFNEHKIIFESLLELFPNNQSKFYKDIKRPKFFFFSYKLIVSSYSNSILSFSLFFFKASINISILS